MQITPLPTWVLGIDRSTDPDTRETLLTLTFYSDDGQDTVLKTVGALRLSADMSFSEKCSIIDDECRKFHDEQLPESAFPPNIKLRVGYAPVMPIMSIGGNNMAARPLPGDKGYEHGIIAKVTCPSHERCPIAKLQREGCIDPIDLVKVIRNEKAARVVPVLWLIVSLLFATYLLIAARAHAQVLNSGEETTKAVNTLTVHNAEQGVEIASMREKLSAISNDVAGIRADVRDQGRELGRIEGIGGSIIGVMAFIQFIFNLNKRLQPLALRRLEGEDERD